MNGREKKINKTASQAVKKLLMGIPGKQTGKEVEKSGKNDRVVLSGKSITGTMGT